MGSTMRSSLWGLLLADLLIVLVNGPAPAIPPVFPWEQVLDLEPLLSVHKKEMLLSAGSSLTVKCTGDHPVSWTYPDKVAQEPPIKERVTITPSNDTDGGLETYESEIHVVDLMYADTGDYRCSYPEDIARGSAASLYVFVYDGENLLAPSYDDTHDQDIPIFLSVHQHSPATIPCLSTHPKMNVRLLKGMAPKTEVDLNKDLTFDPKSGFTILYPNWFYSGMFYCEASMDNVTEEIMIMLTYRASTATPQPELVSSHTNIMVNETLKLRCFVRVSPGVSVTMVWSYTSGDNSPRVHKTQPERSTMSANGYKYDEIATRLTIRGAKVEDQGVYRCTVTNHDGKSNFREQSIYVYERTFVYLTADPEKEVSLGAKDVYLSVKLHMYSKPPPTLIWFKGNRPILENDQHYEYRMRFDSLKLKIFEPQQEDAGTYTLRGYSKDMNTSISILLHVNELPTVEMTMPNSAPYYMVGNYYNLTCSSTGYPIPSIIWYWQPCLQMGCRYNDTKWERVELSRNIPMKETTAYGGRLMIVARESGFYRCVMLNKEGRNQAVESFYVTDIEEGFGMTNTSQSPVEGDMVELTCKANWLNFLRPQLFWMHNNRNIWVTNRTGLTIVHEQNNYSHLLTVRLASVNRSEAGLYYCQVEDTIGRRLISRLSIYVREMQELRFNRPLGGVVLLQPGMKHILECDATGLPVPTITWYKDASPLGPSKQKGISYSPNNTRITFKHVAKCDSGFYTCEASNRAGSITTNRTLIVGVGLPSSGLATGAMGPRLTGAQIGMIVGIVTGVLVLSVFIAMLTRRCYKPKFYYYDHELRGAKATFNPDIPIDEQTDCVSYDPWWEFPTERLNFGRLTVPGKVMVSQL